MTTLDAALDWNSRFPSHHIFACRGKNQPLLSDYLNAASNDPVRIRSWFEFWKNRLHGDEPFWGIAPRLSGIVPVDVDVKPGKNGQETYDLLHLLYGWPRTLTVKTPSGGFHCYYEGEHIFALGTAKTEHRGIDFPQFVIVPGCGDYKVIEDRPIAAAPQWFYHITRRKTVDDTATQIPKVELDTPANIEWAIHYLTHDATHSVLGKNGEKVLRDIGATLKDRGISYETACLLVNEHYNVSPRCEPPWNYDDGPMQDRLTVKIRNAYLYMTEKAPGEDTPEAEFGDDPPQPLTPKDIEAAEREAPAKKAREKIKQRPDQERIWTFPELCEEWVWITCIDRMVLRKLDPDEAELMLKTETFDKRFMYAAPGKDTSVAKAMFMRATKTVRRLDRPVFKPGQPEFLRNGRDFNLWRPSLIVPKQGDTTLWNAHLEYLFPEEADRAYVLNWLAWFLQNISLKPKHALLMAGTIQGTGKSFIAEALSEIIGRKNVSPVGSAELGSTFNKWAMGCKLILIEELRALEKREVANKLHPIITQETIPINNKNQETYSATNCFGVLAMTNDDAAIPLDNTDRRYLVVRTEAVPKDEAYYVGLYAMLKDTDALAAIAWELGHRDVGTYNGQAKAPFTEAKAEMIEAGASQIEQWMLNHADVPPLRHRIVSIDDIETVLPKKYHVGRMQNEIGKALRTHFHGVKFSNCTHRLPAGERLPILWAINDYGAAHVRGVYTPDGPAERVAIYLADRASGEGIFYGNFA